MGVGLNNEARRPEPDLTCLNGDVVRFPSSKCYYYYKRKKIKNEKERINSKLDNID